MNSSWFLRPMAVLRITEYPNSIDRIYRELPNTKEKRLFSIYQSVGREKTAEQKDNHITLDGKGKCEGRKTKKELENQKVDEFAENILTFVRVGLCE